MSALLADRFELEDTLGRGAGGVVHVAVDRQLRCRVALKRFAACDPGELAQFKAEFRIRKGLDHPNLVTLYELFVAGAKEGYGVEIGNVPYLVAMLVAIGVFRASGAMDFLLGGVRCGGSGAGRTNTGFGQWRGLLHQMPRCGRFCGDPGV